MEKENNKSVEKPFLFLIVAVLLMGSLTMLVMSLIKPKQITTSDSQENKSGSSAIKKDDTSISQFFEDEFSGSSTIKDDEFLKNDPFKDACAEVSGDDLPSVSSNTVCLR